MSYVVFFTNGPTPSKSLRAPRKEMTATFDSLGAAINAASRLIDDGAIVWRIKGIDGFMMERRDIELERLRRLELRMQSPSIQPQRPIRVKV
jgi:hypothetical protein